MEPYTRRQIAARRLAFGVAIIRARRRDLRGHDAPRAASAHPMEPRHWLALLDGVLKPVIEYDDTPEAPGSKCNAAHLARCTCGLNARADRVEDMSRKDIAADLDRPHFYSQFWIDVAGGKRDVTVAPELAAEPEPEEADEAEFEPVAKVAPVKKPVKAPEKKPEAPRPTITSLADLANIDLLMKSSAEMDTEEVPDIETGPASDLAPIETDFSPAALDEEPEYLADEGEEADYDVGEDEEEEEDWGGPRKGPRQPKPRRRERPERPERGRGF